MRREWPLLTDKQESICEFVSEYGAHHGYAPAVSEIADHFKVSASAIVQQLLLIEKKGRIKRTPGVARGLVLT